MKQPERIKLVLHNKSVYYGYSFGYRKSVAGEVVFNTGMVGYPETMTDPSYRGQILTLTYPLIGNYGVPDDRKENNLLKNFESDGIQVTALIVSDYSFKYSHRTAQRSLSAWLKEQRVPALYGIDTRALTKELREKGVLLGKIIFDKDIEFDDPNERNLVDEVSIDRPTVYKRGKRRVIVVDCGCKNNIIRSLLRRNITVVRVPWDYDFSSEKCDGILVSNGPGDPKMCGETVTNIRAALEYKTPFFGICLGNQLLSLAIGADTYKLKYGHRSQNQPCMDLYTKKSYITTQNHGFAVNDKTLPPGWEPWFVNLNDGTNEGIRHKNKPFFSVQFHPEATPGPTDTHFLFDHFMKMMRRNGT